MTRASLLASVLALAACGSSPDPALCLGNTCVAVATSIYNADFTGSGTLNTVDLATRAPRLGVDATLDPDTVMKVVGEELFVLQKTSGAVRIYDPKTFALIGQELPTGDADHKSATSFPQDLHVADDGRIYVTLAGNDAAHALAILDRKTPGTLQYVALPLAPGDGDGKPEPFKLHACGKRLFILMQNYTIAQDGFTAVYQPGSVVIYDTDTGAVAGVIPLAGRNPADLTERSGCSDVVVATSASLLTEPDGSGNLEALDLDKGASKGVLATDETLGGRPYLTAAGAGDVLYAAIFFDPQPNSFGQVLLSSAKVIAFDVAKKTVLGDVSGKFGNVNFLRTHDDRLFVGAGVYAGMEAPGKAPRGLYLGATDGTMLPATPIDLHLTPSAIALP